MLIIPTKELNQLGYNLEGEEIIFNHTTENMFTAPNYTYNVLYKDEYIIKLYDRSIYVTIRNNKYTFS